MLRISEFIEIINKQKTLENVFDVYQKEMFEYGYDRIMYSSISDDFNTEYEDAPCLAKNYPDDWINHYVENNYIQLDPVRRYGCNTNNPLIWNELKNLIKLNSIEKKILNEGKEAGLNNGIGFPFYGQHGEIMGVGLAKSIKDKEDSYDVLPIIHILSIQFHISYKNLLAKNNNQKPDIPRLTKRELEVIKWCSKGKGTWEISQILGISEHGIDFHIRNILVKFETHSRISAVVKAIYFGFISP